MLTKKKNMLIVLVGTFNFCSLMRPRSIRGSLSSSRMAKGKVLYLVFFRPKTHVRTFLKWKYTQFYSKTIEKCTWTKKTRYKIGPLECAPYIKALLTCMPRFLANSFFALNSVLNKQTVLFLYSNKLNLSKYTRLEH